MALYVDKLYFVFIRVLGLMSYQRPHEMNVRMYLGLFVCYHIEFKER